jgi:hypothetical protein
MFLHDTDKEAMACVRLLVDDDNEGAYDYGYHSGHTGDTPDLTIKRFILIIIPKSKMESNRRLVFHTPVCPLQ